MKRHPGFDALDSEDKIGSPGLSRFDAKKVYRLLILDLQRYWVE